MNNTKFCCCSGDYCNVNFTDMYVPVADDPNAPPPATEHLEAVRHERQTMIVWSAAICSLVVALAITVLTYKIWRARTMSASKTSPDQAHLMANTPGYTVGMYSVDHLKLVSIVGKILFYNSHSIEVIIFACTLFYFQDINTCLIVINKRKRQLGLKCMPSVA